MTECLWRTLLPLADCLLRMKMTENTHMNDRQSTISSTALRKSRGLAHQQQLSHRTCTCYDTQMAQEQVSDQVEIHNITFGDKVYSATFAWQQAEMTGNATV